MAKSKNKTNKVYMSFEQWKAELFPEDIARLNSKGEQNIADIAINLANRSFDKLLSHPQKA